MAVVPTGVARQPRERQEAWPLLVGERRPRTGRRVSRAPLPASSEARLRAFSPRPSEAAESARWAAGVRVGVSLHRVGTALGVPGHLEGTRASGSPCAPALVPRSPPSPAGASTLPDPSLFQQDTGRVHVLGPRWGRRVGAGRGPRPEGAGQRAAWDAAREPGRCGLGHLASGQRRLLGMPAGVSSGERTAAGCQRTAEGARTPAASGWAR